MPQLAYKDVHQDIPTQPVNPYAELGEALVKAREDSQLSKWDVASFLHVEPWVIDALESGDFQRLTAPVYVKGYLRNYARVVNLPAEPLVERYNQAIGYQPAPAPVPALSQSSDSTEEQQLQWGPYLLAAALILLPILWIYQRTTPEPSSQPKSESSSPSELAVVPEAGQENNDHAVEEQAPAVQANEPDQDSPVNSAETVPSALVSDGLDHIKVRVTSDAWVSIRDHSGRRVAYETVTPGAEREFSGLAPFHVVLGNSPVTTIELNGQVFDQSKYNVGIIARFNLGQTSPRRTQVPQVRVPVAQPDRPAASKEEPSKEEPSTKPSVEQSGPDQVKVYVTADSWVSIRDQKGQRIAYESAPRGAERIYKGLAPFVVVLGNSPATKIELNGKPFNQSHFNVGIIARFKLSK